MTANAVQVQTWNGDMGRHFVAEHARLARMLEPYTERLLTVAAIERTDRVLDIGCGCGETTIRAARAASGGEALGVDISAPMLAKAQREAARLRVGNVRFERADAQTRPFPTAGWDVALSRFGMMFFDDPRAAFAGIAAALRPGGRLVFLSWQEPRRVEYFSLLRAVAADHTDLPAPPGPDAPGPFSLADPERIGALLAQAGFGEVRRADLTVRAWLGRSVEDVIDYYRGMPVARSLLANAGERAAGRIIQAFREALHSRMSADGVRLAADAWLVTART